MIFNPRIEVIAVVLLTLEMVHSLGTCPIFQPVGRRDKSCFEKESCLQDRDCHVMEKCCENPCGVSQCYTINPANSYRWEKCPLESLNINSECQPKMTKFCYKNDCNRCCQHDTICNPAPSILQSSKACYKEICKGLKCQQGAICRIEEMSHKPYCECKTSCNRMRKYVCATDYKRPSYDRTYYNLCYLENKACVNNVSIAIKHDGQCLMAKPKAVVPLKKPYTSSLIYTANMSKSVSIRCYGDRKGVLLRWYQTRLDGTELLMDDSFQQYLGAFIINGRLQEVLALSIHSIGYGSYGLYTCKQMFNETTMQTQVQIQPPEDVIFETTLCLLQEDKGSCDGKFSNYYFDQLANACYNFTYRGCDGNGNNFQTKQECEEKCLKKQPKNGRQFIHIGKKCGKERCDFYAKCVKKNNNSRCICSSRCPFRPNRICASDGETYNTPCAMKLHACKWRKPLVIVYKGECKSYKRKDPKKNTKLSKQPLLCDLRQCNPYAKCYVNPFTKVPHCYCPEKCPFKPDVICASNMEHFLNECFMQRHSCNIGRKLYVLKRGLCFI